MSKMTVEMYKKLIDQIMVECFETSIDDVGNQPYHDWMVDGVSAGEAVGMIIDSELCELFDGDVRFIY